MSEENQVPQGRLARPFVGDAYLEEQRVRDLTRPSFVERERRRQAGEDPEFPGPDGLYLSTVTVTHEGQDYNVRCLMDELGCMLGPADLKVVIAWAEESFPFLDQEEVDDFNIEQRERGFIRWVESNSGKSYAEVVAGANRRAERKQATPKKPQHGYVYLIQGGGYYKIGRAKNPHSRSETLAIQLPYPTILVHIIESDDYGRAEKYLHELYAGKRTNGEWFDLSESDVQDITKLDTLFKGPE